VTKILLVEHSTANTEYIGTKFEREVFSVTPDCFYEVHGVIDNNSILAIRLFVINQMMVRKIQSKLKNGNKCRVLHINKRMSQPAGLHAAPPGKTDRAKRVNRAPR